MFRYFNFLLCKFRLQHCVVFDIKVIQTKNSKRFIILCKTLNKTQNTRDLKHECVQDSKQNTSKNLFYNIYRDTIPVTIHHIKKNSVFPNLNLENKSMPTCLVHDLTCSYTIEL